MAEDKPEEEKKPEEREPKTADDRTAAARTFIQFLKDQGFSTEEGICVLALTSSLLQVEMMMQLLIKNATVMAVPMTPPHVKVTKASDN